MLIKGGDNVIIETEGNVVTCAYCEYFKRFDLSDTTDFFEGLKGRCLKKNDIRHINERICESFVLKSGLYTKKQYPKK